MTTLPVHVDPTPPVGPDDRRPGVAPGGGPRLGWVELAVAAPLAAGATLLALLGGFAVDLHRGPGAVTAVGLIATGLVGATLLALAVRVRDVRALGLRATSPGRVAAGAAAGIGLSLAAVGAVLGVQRLRGVPLDVGALLGPVDGAPLTVAGLVVTGGLLLPLGVELLFRGIGYGALRRYGVVVATAVTAVPFAALHGLTGAAVVALILGVLTALLYERSGSLWPSVAAHAGFALSGIALAAVLA